MRMSRRKFVVTCPTVRVAGDIDRVCTLIGVRWSTTDTMLKIGRPTTTVREAFTVNESGSTTASVILVVKADALVMESVEAFASVMLVVSAAALASDIETDDAIRIAVVKAPDVAIDRVGVAAI